MELSSQVALRSTMLEDGMMKIVRTTILTSVKVGQTVLQVTNTHHIFNFYLTMKNIITIVNMEAMTAWMVGAAETRFR